MDSEGQDMSLELYPYQIEAVERIARSDHPTYLADEMGVGKTPTAIAVAKKRKARRLLILCPSVAKLTWQKELRRWWPEMPVVTINSPGDVAKMRNEGAYILSYALLSQSRSGNFDYTAAVREIPTMDMSVLDEAHALKNPKSIRTRAVLITLKPVLGWTLPMSGTPTPNHQGELFMVLHALFPETIRKTDGRVMKLYEFEEAYCNIAHKRYGNGPMIRQITGSKNIDQLKAKLRPYFIRRTKKAVLPDLPEMAFDTYPVPVSMGYGPETGQAAFDLGKLSDDELLAKLRQGGEHIMRLRQQIGVAKLQGSIEAITDMLEGCQRKVLVFAHHTSVIDGLMTGLADCHPVRLDGRDGTGTRQRSIETFLTDDRCRVFIGQIQAAGTSITLIGPGMECSDVYFVEADFSPGNNVQAASRIHRIGQHDGVQVWFLTAHGTLDDRIQDILSRKARDFHELFG
jgi:SWI/SNF-related matrix-associated actin-dependent regulator of chromatin subfamily A-like protein 1